jgi:hypothetical protein
MYQNCKTRGVITWPSGHFCIQEVTQTQISNAIPQSTNFNNYFSCHVRTYMTRYRSTCFMVTLHVCCTLSNGFIWLHLFITDKELSLIQKCTVLFRVTKQVKLIITSHLHFRGISVMLPAAHTGYFMVTLSPSNPILGPSEMEHIWHLNI